MAPLLSTEIIVWQDDRNDKEYIDNSDIYMYVSPLKRKLRLLPVD
jgi:hypothetical protein